MPSFSTKRLGPAPGAHDAHSDKSGSDRSWNADEAARYIGDLTGELAGIARHTDLDLLAYLLDIVRLEALRTAKRISVRDR